MGFTIPNILVRNISWQTPENLKVTLSLGAKRNLKSFAVLSDALLRAMLVTMVSINPLQQHRQVASTQVHRLPIQQMNAAIPQGLAVAMGHPMHSQI